LVSFSVKAGILKKYLKGIKCKGTAQETGTGYVTNDCLLEVKNDTLEVRAVGDARGIFVHNICHDVEVIDSGEIPIAIISQNKDKEPLGLLDVVEDYKNDEIITVTFDDGKILVVGSRSEWELTTVDATLIQSSKNAKGFYENVARWEKGCPLIANEIEWKDHAIISASALPHIAQIARKVGSMTKKIVITASLTPKGFYITSGSKISNRSLVTDTVHLESDDPLTSQFSHGVGYVFPYVGKCQLYMGQDTGGFVHMWIHEENGNFTTNYFIARVPP